jgi:hypothetical protein
MLNTKQDVVNGYSLKDCFPIFMNAPVKKIGHRSIFD